MPTACRRPDGLTAAIVALAVLLGGMPLTLGIIIHGSEATFTLDVCHPLQKLSNSPAPVVAPIPIAPQVAKLMPKRGEAAADCIVLRDRAAEPPDPPPPRLLA